MPVTFSPAGHKARCCDVTSAPETPEGVLKRACHFEYKTCSELLQSSLTRSSSSDQSRVLPQDNGLVDTVLKAYNHHHQLILRPDDVWLTILSQFSFYVNANAERLRAHFVAHEGKKELIVYAAGNRYTVDHGKLAQQMTHLIDQNVVDPSLREWIMPAFSTTTHTDTTVASVLMMATLKEYFSYTSYLLCGLPSVTLEGTRADWELIVSRLNKLDEYGADTSRWARLLRPVCSRFVHAFDDPHGADNLDFWSKICHLKGGGSGPSYLCGWITAFCAFDKKGRWMGADPKAAPQTLLAHEPYEALELDGAVYHYVDTSKVPQGYADVDVKLVDNGEELQSRMIAGAIGTRVSHSGDTTSSDEGKNDVLRPEIGWWMFLVKSEEQMKADEDAFRKRFNLH